MAKKSRNKTQTGWVRNFVGWVVAAIPIVLPAIIAALTSLANNAELRDQRKVLQRYGLGDLAPAKSGKGRKKG
jgi:hypothetical protein